MTSEKGGEMKVVSFDRSRFKLFTYERPKTIQWRVIRDSIIENNTFNWRKEYTECQWPVVSKI